jgi:hypothetical protein
MPLKTCIHHEFLKTRGYYIRPKHNPLQREWAKSPIACEDRLKIETFLIEHGQVHPDLDRNCGGYRPLRLQTQHPMIIYHLFPKIKPLKISYHCKAY